MMATYRVLCKPSVPFKQIESTLLCSVASQQQRCISVQTAKLQAVTKKFNLPFEDYQKLKRSIKTKQRVAGIPFALTGMFGSSLATAYLFPDMFDATPENVQLIMGLDPLMFCGICGVAASGVSYVLGTNIFKVLWNTMNKEESAGLQARDKDFLQRLEQYRFQGESKFEDDYYGESIKTLSDYRQWVRTQQRKRETSEKFNLNQNKDEEVISS